jgi:hypothetical protein
MHASPAVAIAEDDMSIVKNLGLLENAARHGHIRDPNTLYNVRFGLSCAVVLLTQHII